MNSIIQLVTEMQLPWVHYSELVLKEIISIRFGSDYKVSLYSQIRLTLLLERKAF